MLSARLTVFVTPDTVVTAPGLWRNIVGEEPESSVVQRASATSIETGPFADGTVTLQVQPVRVDLVHEPLGMGGHGQPARLGIFPAAAEPLLSLCHRWARNDSFPTSVQRIALGFVLISPTIDKVTGYRELTPLIDGVPEAADASDFSYQVNRPRPSRASVDGLSLNRLSKWSVGAFRSVIITGSAAPTLSDLHFHLRLDLDMNTNPESVSVIPRENAEGVIDDLFDAAREISERGNRF
jgi:hypothetical protein